MIGARVRPPKGFVSLDCEGTRRFVRAGSIDAVYEHGGSTLVCVSDSPSFWTGASVECVLHAIENAERDHG